MRPLVDTAGKIDPDLPADLLRNAAPLVREALPLVQQLATLMPLLRELQGAIPDVKEILAVVQRLEPVMTDVETRIAGLPGAGFLLRRGEKEIEANSDSPAEQQEKGQE